MVINLKTLNQFVPFPHFRMEGCSQLKHLIQNGDWMHKLNLKDPYFSVRLKLVEVPKVSVVGDSLRVHVPTFLIRTCTTGVYKVIENSNLTPEKNKHHCDN